MYDQDPQDVPEGELGVALDACIDTRIEAKGAIESLRYMHVTLDGLADSHNLPTEPTMLMREVQNEVGEIIDLLEIEVDATDTYASTIRERIRNLD